MWNVSRHLLKRRNPARALSRDILRRQSPAEKETTADPRPVAPFKVRFNCRKHHYHAARTVVQLMLPHLAKEGQPPTDLSPDVQPHVQSFVESALGAPDTLQHEGPCTQAQILSVKEHLSNRLVLQLLQEAHKGRIASSAFPFMDQLWTVSLSTAYTKALQQAREQRLEAFRQNSKRPKEKFEAGLISRAVLCGDVSSPLSASWRKLIDRYSPIIPDRSHVHELENLPQEIAIGELLDECVSQVRAKEPQFKLDLIVDVGGGNGYVSAILGEHQCCDNAVIDPLFPGHSIDCRPRLWADTVAAERAYPSKRRQYTTHRRVALFKDTTWSEDIGTDPSRTAFIAKHLCGSAIDECLRHLEQQKCLPRILVLAPCCFNKINHDTYLNPKYLEDTFSIFGSEALRRVAPLTDWNLSYYQHLQDEATRNKKCSSNVEDDACGCGANYKVWQSETVPSVRDGGKGTVAEMIPCMHGLSQYVEHRINYGRVLWLTERGYTVRLLQYVPPFVTPKNNCIIAIRT